MYFQSEHAKFGEESYEKFYALISFLIKSSEMKSPCQWVRIPTLLAPSEVQDVALLPF